MPNRLMSLLGATAGALVALYLALMVTTVFFASWQTELSHAARETEIEISNLEMEYYQTISRLHKMDPASAGFVTPHEIAYVVAPAGTSLSQATR